MKTYLNPEEIKRLVEAAENLRDKILIRLLYSTGCRISELLGLTRNKGQFVAKCYVRDNWGRRVATGGEDVTVLVDLFGADRDDAMADLDEQRYEFCEWW